MDLDLVIELIILIIIYEIVKTIKNDRLSPLKTGGLELIVPKTFNLSQK